MDALGSPQLTSPPGNFPLGGMTPVVSPSAGSPTNPQLGAHPLPAGMQPVQAHAANAQPGAAASYAQPLPSQQQQQGHEPHPIHHQHHPRDQNHFVSPLLYCFPNVVGPQAPCRYRPQRTIGRGAFSTVWRLQDIATGQLVVGKLSNLAQMTDANKAFARAEAANIRACDHPNIIRLIETFEEDEKLLHILEYADGGDLLTQVEARAEQQRVLQQRQQQQQQQAIANGVDPASIAAASPGPQNLFYQESEILVIMAQLCLAIKYLHDKKIMHRDLKTPNVMVTRSGLLKLGDFGFSRQYEESVSADVGTTFCGTPYYLAPELWRRQPYSYKADIWSLGVIIYELLTLRKPFPASDLNELMSRVLRERSFEPLSEQRCSKELISLVYSMLSVDPAKRPSVRDILATRLMQERGLHLLKVNIKRLKNFDPVLKERIVQEVEKLQSENTTNTGVPAPTSPPP